MKNSELINLFKRSQTGWVQTILNVSVSVEHLQILVTMY